MVLVLMIAAACGSSSPTTSTPIADPIPMKEGTTSAQPTSATAMLAAYERARALLADDQMKGLPEVAREIERTATAAKFSGIATSAAKLASTNDIEAARASFGDVSRELVTVLASDKDLAKGQYVFECPMVKGYRKWVQPNQDMANPYMGKKMLACGGESDWK